MRARLGVMYAKIESTYGTDPVPTGSSNPLMAENIKLDPEHGSNERPDLAVSKSRLKEVGGARKYKLSFEVPLRGSGTAGTATKGLADLMRACDLTETISGGVSATYAPRDGALQSCTIYLYVDGLRYILTGCVGDISWSGKSGELCKVKFSFMCLYQTPTDQSLPSAPTYDTTVPVACKNLTTTIDSYAEIVREFEIKMNNKVVERGDLTATHGIRGYEIVERNPEATFTVEASTLSAKNRYTKFEGDTVVVVSLVLGTVAGNIWTFAASYGRMRNIPLDDQDGMFVHKLPLQLSRSAGGDELSWVNT